MSFFRWLKSLFASKEAVTPVPTPNSGEDYPWMEIARTQLGVKEIAGSKANPDIVKYHKTTGGWSSDEVAWCASFICWVLIQAGLHKKGAQGLTWALAVHWLKYGEKCALRKGAIVTIKTSIGNHVTFCDHVYGDGTFDGLGGNQSNACKVTRYNVSQISGCTWPKGYPVIK